MIKTETGTVEPHRNADEFALRRFWLANVMIEKGNPLPAKSAGSTMRAIDRNLTRRLRQLRRLELAAKRKDGRTDEFRLEQKAEIEGEKLPA